MTGINFDNVIHIQPIEDGVSEQEFEQEVGRLDNRINTIEASSDVTDVVGTYSDLENYDISTLTDNDIIKVLVDSTHNDATSYYRWSITSETFSYIGSLGPFASEDYVDNNFANKDLSNLSTQGNARLHALKGYSDEGELLTDAEGLADVTSYAHSTFDLSKFTVAGSPVISDDGLLTSNNSTSYVTIPTSVLQGLSSGESFSIEWYANEITGRYGYAFGNDTLANQRITIGRFNATNNFYFQIYLNEEGTDTKHLVSGNWNVNEFRKKRFTYDGIDTYELSAQNATGEWISLATLTSLYKLSEQTTPLRVGTNLINGIDFKQLSITVDGVEVFSGNKTGIDTYTIDGNTVTIPYTLSKTGSKIVDSTYRTQVNAVYNEYGYAPYYTLSDTDFTLPMGEVYGMIERKMPNTTAIVTISQTDYNNLTVIDPNTLYIITGA